MVETGEEFYLADNVRRKCEQEMGLLMQNTQAIYECVLGWARISGGLFGQRRHSPAARLPRMQWVRAEIAPGTVATSHAGGNLLQESDFTYLGAFKVPGGRSNGSEYGFDYG